MKKKTTWAATVVKKQLQTCCKHQAFSVETTERDDTSQGFESPSRVIHISSPIKEAANPILLRRKSFNVSHAKSLLTTPEPLTPFRKSVESAIPLYRSSTFKSTRLQNVKSSPHLVTAASQEAPLESSKGKVRHKSGPLPVLQQLLRGGLQGSIISSPLNVKKQLSGPLPSAHRKPLSGAPSPKQSNGRPSPQRLSKVKFSPLPGEAISGGRFSNVIAEEEASNLTQIVVLKVRQPISPVLDKKGPKKSRNSKSECNPPATSSEVKLATRVVENSPTAAVVSEIEHPGEHNSVHVVECENLDVGKVDAKLKGDTAECVQERMISAAVAIQTAYRGHRARKNLDCDLQRRTNPSDDATEDLEDEAEPAPSISTQMSRTDPQKQRRNPPPRVNKRWNGSIRSAQDHQALLRSRQEAALKRERAMEYALSRQRWRTGSKPLKGPAANWHTDDRLPDKPGWVRNWLERATRMSGHENKVFDDDFEQKCDLQSDSLSMKSTVGMCTTDIGSVEHINLGWPLSLRQQHAAGMLQPKTPIPEPEPLRNGTSPPLKHPRGAKFSMQEEKCDHVSEAHRQTNQGEESSTDATESGIVTPASHKSLYRPIKHRNEAHEVEFLGDVLCDDIDLESVGSCEGAIPALNKVPSPGVGINPRMQHGVPTNKASNSNSLKEAARREKLLSLQLQTQISVVLSDGDSADTTAASMQQPFWRP